jgi:hypothetical protein
MYYLLVNELLPLRFFRHSYVGQSVCHRNPYTLSTVSEPRFTYWPMQRKCNQSHVFE